MKFPTGSTSLDHVLGGGYEAGVLTEFYGESQSLKTTLSAYVPIGRVYLYWLQKNSYMLKDHAFFIVDGDGGFDFERASQVWKGMGCSEQQIDHIVSLIKYFQPTTFGDQHKVIMHTIPETIKPPKKKEEEAEKKKRPKPKPILPLLLVADPLIAIYRSRMLTTPRKFKMVSTGEYTGKLSQQLTTLRRLAVQHGCPCLVTSWPGSPVKMGEENAEQPMIGGRAFGFLAKTIVFLQIPVESTPLRKATLYKHRSRPAGLTGSFNVTENGIEDIQQVVEVQESDADASSV